MRSKTRSSIKTITPDARPAPTDKANLKRRGFLLTLGIGTAGAAAVAVRSLGGAAVEPSSATAVDGESGAGYTLTDHIRRYYHSAKI
jgi:hypothetical protein